MFGAAQPANPNNDFVVPSSPNDSVSAIHFSPTSNLMLASSWNRSACCWDVQGSGQIVPKAMITHSAPVLCCGFHPDGTKAFTGSCDKTARLWNLATNQSVQVAQHDAPIKELFYIGPMNLLVTGSWDKTLRYWDLRTPKPVATVELPERLYAMDVLHPVLVCATAGRQIAIFDLTKPQVPFKKYESPLKMQSRAVAIFPDRTGFAISSIEGRCAIQHIEEKLSRKNFAFKCHRHGDDVYAVNSIAFHPSGKFASAGSDGVYVFWDKDTKQRLKMFNRMPNSITCSSFNKDGSIYAYAMGYDWSKGIQHYDKTKPTQIYLHAVTGAEMRF